jgi:hypothetical protein
MWHPQNQGNYFNGQIVYFDYPKSQVEVDSIISSRGWPFKAIFDEPNGK